MMRANYYAMTAQARRQEREKNAWIDAERRFIETARREVANARLSLAVNRVVCVAAVVYAMTMITW